MGGRGGRRGGDGGRNSRVEAFLRSENGAALSDRQAITVSVGARNARGNYTLAGLTRALQSLRGFDREVSSALARRALNLPDL